MTLPNFLIIGAARSGTTALYEYLSQHPDVFMSEPKEPHYFALKGAPARFRGPGDRFSINRVAVTSPEAYEDLFSNAGDARAVGEASVSYLYSPLAAARIREELPDVRLICMLRNPAERAFSAYSFMRARMFEPEARFEDALADEDRRVADGWHHIWHYRRMGMYGEQLARYLDLFPRDQIRVYLYRDFRQDPAGIVADAFRFIGVDPAFKPTRTPRTVVSGEPRSRLLQAGMMAAWKIHPLIRPLLPARFRKKVWRNLNQANLGRATVEPETAAALLETYEPDVTRLERLIDRDLSAWRPAPVQS